MRKLFKERKLFKGGNYMRKYGNIFEIPLSGKKVIFITAFVILNKSPLLYEVKLIRRK